MLSYLFLIALLGAPAQSSRLEIANVRPTYGGLGSSRADFRIPLGDILHVAFDIDGLEADKSGRIRFTTTLEVEDDKGKHLFKQDPSETFRVNLVGGKVRHSVFLSTGLDQPPGKYTLKVTIKDVLGRKETTLVQPFEVSPLDFSLVRFSLTYDNNALMPAPCVGVVGQTLFVNLIAVGFKLDAKEQQGSVQAELTLVDESGKGISLRPLKGDFPGIPATFSHLPFRFDLPIQRAGQFKIVIKATDLVTKKTSTLSVPIVAVDPGR